MSYQSEHYLQQEQTRQKRFNAKKEQRADDQHFLASFFPPQSAIQKKKGQYDEQEVNGFIIVARYSFKRKEWTYQVFSKEHLRTTRREEILTQKMRYTPSTGGQQKYPTVPRKI